MWAIWQTINRRRIGVPRIFSLLPNYSPKKIWRIGVVWPTRVGWQMQIWQIRGYHLIGTKAFFKLGIFQTRAFFKLGIFQTFYDRWEGWTNGLRIRYISVPIQFEENLTRKTKFMITFGAIKGTDIQYMVPNLKVHSNVSGSKTYFWNTPQSTSGASRPRPNFSWVWSIFETYQPFVRLTNKPLLQNIITFLH